MGYETKITCDQCGAEATVPAPGAAPTGWTLIRVLEPGLEKPSTYSLCGWQCLTHFAQLQIAQNAGRPIPQAQTPRRYPDAVRSPFSEHIAG